MPRITDKGELAEIREFYDGSWASVLDLSFNFRVSPSVIARIVNHKNMRAKSKLTAEKWKKKYPSRSRELYKKWYRKNREKVLANCKERYWEDPEKSRKIGRERASKYYRNLKGRVINKKG